MKEYTKLKEYYKAEKENFGNVQMFKVTEENKVTGYMVKYESHLKRDCRRSYEFTEYKQAYEKLMQLAKHIQKITKVKESKKRMYFIRTAFDNLEIPVQKQFFDDFIDRLNAFGIDYYKYKTEGENYIYTTILPKDKYYEQ